MLGFSQGTGSPCAIALCYHTKVQSLEKPLFTKEGLNPGTAVAPTKKFFFFFLLLAPAEPPRNQCTGAERRLCHSPGKEGSAQCWGYLGELSSSGSPGSIWLIFSQSFSQKKKKGIAVLPSLSLVQHCLTWSCQESPAGGDGWS